MEQQTKEIGAVFIHPNIELFTNVDFADSGHFSDSGAEKFSSLIARYIYGMWSTGIRVYCIEYVYRIWDREEVTFTLICYGIAMKMIKIAFLVFCAVFWPERFVLAASAQKGVEAISSYLNSIVTLEASFLQVTQDGGKSSGKLFIHRPGRMRMEYDPPNRNLIIAGGGNVAIFDGKSNQSPIQYAIQRTPLKFFLARYIDLEKQADIIDYEENSKAMRVLLRDPKRPEVGTIELVFTRNPVELVQWRIIDEAGNLVVVTLDKIKKGKKIAPSSFNITAETMKRSR